MYSYYLDEGTPLLPGIFYLNRLLDIYRATGMHGAMPDSVLREIDCLILDDGHPGNKIQVAGSGISAPRIVCRCRIN